MVNTVRILIEMHIKTACSINWTLDQIEQPEIPIEAIEMEFEIHRDDHDVIWLTTSLQGLFPLKTRATSL